MTRTKRIALLAGLAANWNQLPWYKKAYYWLKLNASRSKATPGEEKA